MVDKKRFIAPRGPRWSAEKNPLWLSSSLKKKFIFIIFLFFLHHLQHALNAVLRSDQPPVAMRAAFGSGSCLSIEPYDDGNVKVQRRNRAETRALTITGGGIFKGWIIAGGGGKTMIWEHGGLVELRRGRTSGTEMPQWDNYVLGLEDWTVKKSSIEWALNSVFFLLFWFKFFLTCPAGQHAHTQRRVFHRRIVAPCWLFYTRVSRQVGRHPKTGCQTVEKSHLLNCRKLCLQVSQQYSAQ